MKTRNYVVFYLNQSKHQVYEDQAHLMLAEYLRYQKGYTGTKIVCAEGDCGACTVLKYSPLNKFNSKNYFLPINSCITPLTKLDGSYLVSVEGVQKDSETLSEVQTKMVECHGSQCGFCTPGFIMTLSGLVEKKCAQKVQTISEKEARNALTGNLCRCTGYKPIIEAATAVKADSEFSLSKKYISQKKSKDLLSETQKPVYLKTNDFQYYSALTIKQAQSYLKKNKSTRIVASATDLGVFHNKRKLRLNNYLSLHLIKELYEIKTIKGRQIKVGALVTLADLRTYLKNIIPEFSKFLDLFASPQIKNAATLIGNVANASPIGDTPPFLLVTRAQIEIQTAQSKILVPIEKFYKGYRKTALKPGQFISAIYFEIPDKTDSLKLYKVSQRKDMDISVVNMALLLKKDPQNQKIESLSLALGGVAATPLLLKDLNKIWKGVEFDQLKSSEKMNKSIELIQNQITPLSDLRGSSLYRRQLTVNLFKKFFREIEL